MNVSICRVLIMFHICFMGARNTIANTKLTIIPEVIDESINMKVYLTARIKVVFSV
jgi:hypothetical protein